MPISNNFISQNSTIFTPLNLSVSGGGNTYRSVKEAFVELQPNTPLILVPGTESKINREIFVRIKDPVEGDKIKLYFVSKNDHPKIISCDDIYLDTSDGGIPLICESDNKNLTVEITVRQDSEIDYNLGIPIPIGEELMINPQIRITNFTWDLHTFYPGREISFSLIVNPVTPPPGYFHELSVIIFNQILSSGSQSLLTEPLIIEEEIATLPLTGGNFSFTPDFSRHIGGFISRYINSESINYTIRWIPIYLPNEESPENGGIFTLSEFVALPPVLDIG